MILREPGIGRVTDSESCPVCCNSEAAVTAFMAFVLWWARSIEARGRSGGASGHGGVAMAVSAKLPYAGLNRIRFEGTVSTAALIEPAVPPLQAAFDHVAEAATSSHRPRRRALVPLLHG